VGAGPAHDEPAAAARGRHRVRGSRRRHYAAASLPERVRKHASRPRSERCNPVATVPSGTSRRPRFDPWVSLTLRPVPAAPAHDEETCGCPVRRPSRRRCTAMRPAGLATAPAAAWSLGRSTASTGRSRSAPSCSTTSAVAERGAPPGRASWLADHRPDGLTEHRPATAQARASWQMSSGPAWVIMPV
jgi:hypothetical protein